MTNYELCRYYLEIREEIMDEWLNCVSKSLDFLDDIINKIDNGELNLAAGTKYYESYYSIDTLYRNHVIDRNDFEKLSLQLFDQIIANIQYIFEHKDKIKENVK